MKKIIAIVLTMLIVLSLAACGSTNKGNETTTDNTLNVKDAQELLTTIWGSYAENEKFSAMGGDANNSTNDAPGAYALDDAAALNSVFGLPEDMVAKVDDAASLMHMMNANTFTCAAFHVKDSGDVTTVSDALKDSIMNRQWICGFPDKLVVLNVGDYVISVFGSQELVDNFKDKTIATYDIAAVAYDEAIL